MRNLSALVRAHFEKNSVSEQYLFNTPFTKKDLQDICAIGAKEASTIKLRKTITEKPRSYQSYLDELAAKRKTINFT